MARRPARRTRPPAWTRAGDRALLETRLRDLGLDWRATWLRGIVEQVREELAWNGIALRPHVWLSTEWFSPDGIPGIAVPFYLAHERLIRLEKRMMFSAEGATERRCLELMRHEAGHAVCTAFRLHHRQRWRDTFGHYSTLYPDSYVPRPRSRDYVLHLSGWYAQAHPAEDFAETFAVWLDPTSKWRQRYRDWPALAKLQVVDSMMESIMGVRPVVRSRRFVEPISSNRDTLREYYEQKQERYGSQVSTVLDEDLTKLFSPDPRHRARPTAASFLRRNRGRIRRHVVRWTDEVPYTVDHVLEDMIARCRQEGLRLTQSETRTFHEATLMVAVHTTRTAHRIPHRILL